MNPKLPLRGLLPTQGWKQFLASRKEMLDAYDKAKTQTNNHSVKTLHGRIAEAQFRKWLSGFLPKKYGITSGYIISQGIPDINNTPHFDIIVYDQLESPILWTENSPDSSEQGNARAIPAEYVKCVIEVKSSLNQGTVKDAIRHLNELKPLMSGFDSENERLKIYLPNGFFCATIFFELREENEYEVSILDSFIDAAIELRGYFGGIVLRGGRTKIDSTGRIEIMSLNTDATFPKRSMLEADFTCADTRKVSETAHYTSVINWDVTYFSKFAFDILAALNENYKPNQISSFYALGSRFHEEMYKAMLNNTKK